MNRNTEAHFAQLPSVNISRSKFDRSFTHKTTFNTGELVPVYVDPDIVPGDTVSMKQSEIIRMMTPIAPVMDNSYMDFYWFFVPNRLVWDNFKMMMGENETAPWTQTVEKTIPQIQIDTNGNNTISGVNYCTRDIKKGSVLNHMGIPMTNWTNAAESSANYKRTDISQLPTRAYCLIWNEFFRDENLQNPVNVPKTDTSARLKNQYHADYISDPDATQVSMAYLGGLPCLKVCKPHDYFTSCLPGAQKGPAVALPLSTEELPIRYKWNGTGTKSWDGTIAGFTAGPEQHKNNATEEINAYGPDHEVHADYGYTKDDLSEYVLGPGTSTSIVPFTLYGDLSKATGATVAALRTAFSIQKFYERDARGGTRYIENVKSHFGVTNPDFRLQRPEYLGGFRQRINMNQVVQNSPLIENVSSTPLGTTGAYSVTTGQNSDVFTHSFTEHGILLGLCCIRTDHTYQQGINRAWFKKKRLDFYSPEFANLSEQAVLNQELYMQGTSQDKEAFGYQECWAEMRYMPDICSGEIAGTYGQTLQYWTYADYYSELPSLGNKWIQETDVNVGRTLAIQNHDQFIADFYFGAIYTRPMPLYSIPGLIDHH